MSYKSLRKADLCEILDQKIVSPLVKEFTKYANIYTKKEFTMQCIEREKIPLLLTDETITMRFSSVGP